MFSFVPDVNINSSPKIRSSEKLTLKIKNGTTASFTVQRKDGIKIWDTSIGKQTKAWSHILDRFRRSAIWDEVHPNLDLYPYKQDIRLRRAHSSSVDA